MAEYEVPEPVNTPTQQTPPVTVDQWQGLAEAYKMRIYTCDKDGAPTDTLQVLGVPTDGDMAADSQYSSPFDNSNPEHRLPTMMAMLQDGSWVDTLDTGLQSLFGVEMGAGTRDMLNSFEGRSNFTKVNSTQIYTSSEPITFSFRLALSAWRNANLEVEQQLAHLYKWQAPISLAENSILGEALETQSLMALFPSQAPPFIAMLYGHKLYRPMILKSVSAPFVAPMTKGGDRLALSVDLTVMTRRAWDQQDFNNIFNINY